MEKLTDKIEEIISGSVACENCNTPSGHKLVIKDIIEAVKTRDSFVLGEDDIGWGFEGAYKQIVAKNDLRDRQRKRAEESL